VVHDWHTVSETGVQGEEMKLPGEQVEQTGQVRPTGFVVEESARVPVWRSAQVKKSRVVQARHEDGMVAII